MCLQVLMEATGDSFKLELQVVVICPMWVVGITLGFSERAVSIPLTVEPSLQLLIVFFLCCVLSF